MILQLRHTSLIAQSLKEIHSDREAGLIDIGEALPGGGGTCSLVPLK